MAEASPSERELDILKVLWDLGESKVRGVHEVLNTQQKIAFTTVQTLLRFMAEKGLMMQRAGGRSLHYSPKHTIDQVSSRFLKRVIDGSLDKLVLNMLQVENVIENRLVSRLSGRRKSPLPAKRGEVGRAL